MSEIDVRQLPDSESLEEAPFPAPRQSDFRVHLAPSVHLGIADHAGEDTSVEICGVLVGGWNRDADGPFVLITDYIRCDNAASKFAEVTFTHESWSQINQEMDSKHADSRIVGWYHSHPDFGIFLSDRDCFIQENFFSGAGQIAYVVDPVRKLEGIFEWRRGKPEPMSHYWVGNKIIPVEASKKSAAAAMQDHGGSGIGMTQATDLPSAPPPIERRSTLTLLSWLCLFLMGYLLASMNSRWEREKIIQGTVAHYGVNKIMRLGFEDHLRETRGRLDLIDKEVDALLKLDQSAFDEEKQKEFAERKQRVAQALRQSGESLRRVEELYGYSDIERTALASYVAAKQAELTAALIPQGSSQQGDSKTDSSNDKSKAQTSKATSSPATSSKTPNPDTSSKTKPATGAKSQSTTPSSDDKGDKAVTVKTQGDASGAR